MATAFNVSLNGRHIDTVFYSVSNETVASAQESVRRSLIGHDGYDPGIKVRKAYDRRPRPKKHTNTEPTTLKELECIVGGECIMAWLKGEVSGKPCGNRGNSYDTYKIWLEAYMSEEE